MIGLVSLGMYVVFGLACRSQSRGGAQPVIRPPAPQSRPAVPVGSANLPVSFTVTERSGVARPDGLLMTGIPLAAGAVSKTSELGVTAAGHAVPAAIEPAAWWADGSLRWVTLRLPVALRADETKTFRLERETGRPSAAPEAFLPQASLVVTTDQGTQRFEIRPGLRRTTDGLAVRVDVEALTKDRTRLRVGVAQVGPDRTWRAITVELDAAGDVKTAASGGAIRRGALSAVVRHAAERGPKALEPTDRGVALHLYPRSAPPFPADRGFHVSHEIILERDADPDELDRRVAKPLRIGLPAGYVHATRAMGLAGAPTAAGQSFDAGVQASHRDLLAAMRKPENRGWTTWGDFYDGKSGMAYAGYLNQEYDPATALFLQYARRGDPVALDTALVMARQYADNGVSLAGGCFQHRATSDAFFGQLIKALAHAMRTKWRGREDTPMGDARLLNAAERDVGEKARKYLGKVLGDCRATSLAEREMVATEAGAAKIIERVRERASNSQVIAQLRRGAQEPARFGVSLKNLAGHILKQPAIKRFGLGDPDAVFAPFWRRYGGSWERFPRFHSWEGPRTNTAHTGGHSLVEMLVWGSLWSGDPWLRDTALRVARHHAVDGLAKKTIDGIEWQLKQRDREVGSRELGWPLINLLAAEVLTERTEPDLDRAVKRSIDQLVATILAVPIDDHEGGLHVGVVSEALARHHESRDGEQVLGYLVRLTRHWSDRYWDSARAAVHYQKNEKRAPNFPAQLLNGLCAYGITYAAWKSGDEQLCRRSREILAGIQKLGPTDYAKAFGQVYRNSQRALDLVGLLPL